MKRAIRIIMLLGIILASVALPRATSRSFAAGAMNQTRDTVRLQLKWVTQAQFAGYYIAKAKGFYDAQALDVQILPGSADSTPEQVVASGQAEFGVDWLPSLFVSRESGMNLQNIAQVFQRSGTTEITWKNSGIASLSALRGRTAAVWCCGNQWELHAALRKTGLDPERDLRLVDQPSDMGLFLDHQVDAAAAETYNELAQVLESVNPATGKLYTLDDLTVFNLEDEGAGMLQDGIFVSASWIVDPQHRDVAVRFLRASLQGWIYCRDHAEECVQAVLANGPSLGAGHQRWMMNEVNNLIWPSPHGIGLMDHSHYARTVDIALQFHVISGPPDDRSYRTDLAQEALAGIRGDISGPTWQKAPVEVTAGGK